MAVYPIIFRGFIHPDNGSFGISIPSTVWTTLQGTNITPLPAGTFESMIFRLSYGGYVWVC